jgi:hypothetical protein
MVQKTCMGDGVINCMFMLLHLNRCPMTFGFLQIRPVTTVVRSHICYYLGVRCCLMSSLFKKGTRLSSMLSHTGMIFLQIRSSIYCYNIARMGSCCFLKVSKKAESAMCCFQVDQLELWEEKREVA